MPPSGATHVARNIPPQDTFPTPTRLAHPYGKLHAAWHSVLQRPPLSGFSNLMADAVAVVLCGGRCHPVLVQPRARAISANGGGRDRNSLERQAVCLSARKCVSLDDVLCRSS